MSTIIQEIAALNPLRQRAFLDGLNGPELYDLLYNWEYWARPDQLTPKGDYNVWLILSGRGWGKTRTAAEDVKSYGLAHKNSRIAVVAPTYGDARDTCIEGESGLLNILPPDRIAAWNRSLGELLLTNGTKYKLFSAEEPERMRGPQNHRAWFDELCAAKDPVAAWTQLVFGLRLGKKPQVVVTTTPKPIALLKELVQRKDVHVTRGTTFDNAANLAPAALATLRARYGQSRTGRQELYGEILDDVEGALWKRRMIEDYRVTNHPQLKRIVVAIDPAVTAEEGSDETGIVVAGVGIDNHGYILADKSLRASPNDWAGIAVAAYNVFHADRIIGEVNNGGDLIETVIRSIDRHVSYSAVRASRGKMLRAEPVSSLYERGLVHHVGGFPELEDQMCSWELGQPSPDRCFVAGTPIATGQGDIPIENIQAGMKVWTRQGLKSVISSGMTQENAKVKTVLFSDGRTLTGTPNHPIYVQGKGFIPIDSLVWDDIIETWKKKQSCLTEYPLSVIQKRKKEIIGFIIGLTWTIKEQKASALSIGKYGSRIMGLFQRDVRSTTRTKTHLTMLLRILSALPKGNMPHVTRENVQKHAIKTWRIFGLWLLRGTLPLKVLSGTVYMVKSHGRIERQENSFVFNVVMNMIVSLIAIVTSFAPVLAYLSGTKRLDDIMKIDRAWCAEPHLTSRNRRSKSHVPVSVLGLLDAQNSNVYNFQVEDAHEYYAQGVLVHNCDALVWAMTELMITNEPTADEQIEAMKRRAQLAQLRTAMPAKVMPGWPG